MGGRGKVYWKLIEPKVRAGVNSDAGFYRTDLPGVILQAVLQREKDRLVYASLTPDEAEALAAELIVRAAEVRIEQLRKSTAT